MEQPNATGDERARLTPTFWLLVGLTGVATGLFGDLMMLILHGTAHLVFGYHHGSFQAATERASGLRRVVGLAGGGLVTGVGWYLLRRFTKGERSDLDDSLWTGTGELSFRRSFLSSVLSEVAVGSGGSIGREAAPKLMGAVSGSVLSRWGRLSPAQRRLLVACGGGAGMAAVYNVPLGGTLMAAELLYGSLSLPVILPALACSWIATATSWISLPIQPTYTDIPTYHVAATQLLVAVGYIRLIGWVSHHRLSGWKAALGPLGAFTALGLVGLRYPQLFGNGKDMAHQVFLGSGTLALMFALFALKPLVTSACLGSGATGGLFTPTMSTGAMLGGFLGLAWSLAWPGAPVGSYAIIGAAAMIGAGTQAPLSSLVLVLELTRSTDSLIVPMIAATMLATAVARYLDGYSIYSARLPA
jgi:CIC family chloride channel protein